MKETVNWSFEDQEFTTTLQVEAKPQEALSIADRIRRLADEVERRESASLIECDRLRSDVERLNNLRAKLGEVSSDARHVILALIVALSLAVGAAVWGWLT